MLSFIITFVIAAVSFALAGISIGYLLETAWFDPEEKNEIGLRVWWLGIGFGIFSLLTAVREFITPLV